MRRIGSLIDWVEVGFWRFGICWDLFDQST